MGSRTYKRSTLRGLGRRPAVLAASHDSANGSPDDLECESVSERLARLNRVVSAANEAMLRATSPPEMYERICESVLHEGSFIAAVAFAVNEHAATADMIAAAGALADRGPLGVSRDAATPECRTLASVACNTRKPCISDDYLNDERTAAWRTVAPADDVRSAAAFPIVREERVHAVVVFYSSEPDAFDQEAVKLLERVAANIGYAHERLDREAERVLRESEERYRAILQTIEDAYYESDLRGNLMFCNFAYGRLMACSPDELRGRNYREYVAPEEIEQISAIYHRVYESRAQNQLFETQLIRKDGRRIYVEGSIQLILNAAGEMTGFRGIVRDVTKRRHEANMLALEHAITRHLAEGQRMRRTLHEVLRAIGEATSWQMGSYWRFDEGTRVFTLIVGWSRPSVPVDALAYFEERKSMAVPANGIMGHVYETRRALWLPDIEADVPHVPIERIVESRERFRHTKARAHLLFPVFADGKVIGLVSYSSQEIKEPDERLLQATRIIGEQVGQFLQRKHAEEVLRESEARFRALTDLSSDWYWELDENYHFCRFEGRLVTQRPRSFAPYMGKLPWDLLESADAEPPRARYFIERHEPFRDRVSTRVLPNGRVIYFSSSGEPVFDAKGRFVGYRGIGRDITQQKLAEQKIHFLATHDALTELPNRVMFNQMLGMALESAKRHMRRLAVLFIDIDRFKVINDTLGHEAGDKLLQQVAGRLRQTLRTSDVIARLGGDEFVVLLQEIESPAEVATVARKILSGLIKPVQLGEQEYRVTGSIGIAMYPGDGEDETTLMKNADMAMYLAKEEGRNNYQFYSQSIQQRSIERLAIETNLREAVEREEFFLQYQPKLDLRTGAISGVEALIRWQSPLLGLVSPTQFIPLAEETGLIVPIGKWVLRTACAQSVAWQRAGIAPVRMAVNLSARQFADENLLADIATVLQETGLKPELLELEITEGMVMHDADRAARVLTAIKQMGVRLAIDDFGTGYSSLAQIKRFPLDILKVDRSFIRDISTDPEDRAITQAIIAMAKTLDLTVVAEGVETREQADFLRSLACDELQGFYFSKPLDTRRLGELLQAHEAGGASSV